MASQEIIIPAWYNDSSISESLRYKSFVSYHNNASMFLIEKIRSYVRWVGHPNKNTFLDSYLWIKVPQFLPEWDPSQDLKNLRYHHDLEVLFLMKKLRALIKLP